MAVSKKTLNGLEIKVHNVDHPPPHFHVYFESKDLKIKLTDLAVLNPPPNTIPPKINQAIKNELEAMRQAWDEVTIIPTGSSPGKW